MYDSLDFCPILIPKCFYTRSLPPFCGLKPGLNHIPVPYKQLRKYVVNCNGYDYVLLAYELTLLLVFVTYFALDQNLRPNTAARSGSNYGYIFTMVLFWPYSKQEVKQ